MGGSGRSGSELCAHTGSSVSALAYTPCSCAGPHVPGRHEHEASLRVLARKDAFCCVAGARLAATGCMSRTAQGTARAPMAPSSHAQLFLRNHNSWDRTGEGVNRFMYRHACTLHAQEHTQVYPQTHPHLHAKPRMQEHYNIASTRVCMAIFCKLVACLKVTCICMH